MIFHLGAPVSSLYGAPAHIMCWVPSVFAYLLEEDLAFTDIPESFNLPLGKKLQYSTGGCSNQL